MNFSETGIKVQQCSFTILFASAVVKMVDILPRPQCVNDVTCTIQIALHHAYISENNYGNFGYFSHTKSNAITSSKYWR